MHAAEADTRRRGPMLTTAFAVLLVASGCAPEPGLAWVPAQPEPVPGIALAADLDDAAAPTGDPGSPADLVDPAVPGSGADPLPGANAESLESGELGLAERRIRADRIGLSARFVQIPGVPSYDAVAVDAVRAAIALTGGSYAPEAHPVGSGLADRGCVNGAAAWPAPRVLSDPATGPVGGSGVSLVCDVVAAFGDTLVVALRTVAGDATAVTTDSMEVAYVNVVSGAVETGTREWAESAPNELWEAAVTLARRAAGSLSTAPVEPPNEESRARAQAALDGAFVTPDGDLQVTFPEGIGAPELAGLGDAGQRAVTLTVDADTAWEWASEQRRAMLTGTGVAFSGVRESTDAAAVDCDLLPCVALTFDDGPLGYTAGLLDSLASVNAPATFYVLGGQAAAAPDVIARAVAEGHEIGSHTMRHIDLTSLPREEAVAEVYEAARIVEGITGVPVVTYRPPYGAIDGPTQEAIGMPAVLWTVDPNDWQKPGPEALLERSVPVASPGGVILFHDIYPDSVGVAADVVIGLRDRGFELVTVTELFGGQVPAGVVRGR